MPNGQIPTPVLPNLALAAANPLAGLQEIRTSFSQSLANIEGALAAGLPFLPAGIPGLPGGVAGPLGIRLPRIEDFFKGPGAALQSVLGGGKPLQVGGPPSAPPPATPGVLKIG